MAKLDDASELAKSLPAKLSTHEELVQHLPAVLRYLNATPQLARLLLINPLLVFEDLGIEVNEDLQDHIRRTLGFPKGRIRRISELRQRVRRQLSAEFPGQHVPLPKTPRERAELLFGRLKLQHAGPRPEALTVEQLRSFREAHPLVAALHDLGRLERGAIQYQTRGEFERHKAGVPHHSWIASLHFRKGA